MNEIQVMELMNNINYGWIDKNGNSHLDDYDTFSDDYILQSPEELIESKLGVCWDQVELERYYFKDINVKTFFMVHYDNDNCPTHTFLTYEKDNKYYWFEHSWEIFKGIHEYNSLDELLKDVISKFIDKELNNNYIEDNLQIHEYDKPNYHIDVQEFYKHCEQGNLVLQD